MASSRTPKQNSSHLSVRQARDKASKLGASGVEEHGMGRGNSGSVNSGSVSSMRRQANESQDVSQKQAIAVQRLQAPGWIRKLEKSVNSDLTLQPFLEEVLPIIVEHFEALGGLVWLRPHGGHGSWFALRHQMEPIQFAPIEAKKHERLVQFAWHHKSPLLLAPKSKTAGQPGNPINYSLAFAPVVHWGEPIALLELVMLAEQAPKTSVLQRALLHALQVSAGYLHSGLRPRLNLPAATISQAAFAVDAIKDEIKSYEDSLRKSIEARLRQFQGWSFGSLTENQAFAKMVHELLDQHGLRVQCPECGNPAILRCIKAGNSKHGVFVFDHYLETGRTFHGGPTSVPGLTIIAKPQRRSGISEQSTGK